MKSNINIENYLSTTEYTTRKELCKKTGLSDREVRRRVSNLKKERVVLSSSDKCGYKLAGEYRQMTKEEREETKKQIQHSLNDCLSRSKNDRKPARKFIAYLKKAEQIDAEEMLQANENHYS